VTEKTPSKRKEYSDETDSATFDAENA